ncbi:hypothetical protein THIOM_005374 [Candidatus Thiomargarita nelsonii]|uniref:Uncharacterized protein n=1 Tax=Candidatus Thiomargarita nelsonii TaxID=1003181 RepID=A0A176RTF3_9GAMM|nr:hypothetical protein THIOM_005374 [Candidatus Thiomargarita nelsonii]
MITYFTFIISFASKCRVIGKCAIILLATSRRKCEFCRSVLLDSVSHDGEFD